MELRKSIIRVFAANVAKTILGIVGLVIFARVLGPTELGVFLLFQAVIGILGSITDFGIHGAVEKRVSEGEYDNILGTSIAIEICLLFMTSTFILSFSNRINAYVGSPVAKLIILAITVEQTGKLLGRTLSGELEVGKVETFKTGRHSLFIILSLVLLYFNPDANSLVYSHIISWVIFSICIYKSISTHVNFPSITSARSIMSFSKYNLIASIISGKAYSWLDVLFIGFFLSNVHVSSYEIAWRISGMVLILSKSIVRPLFPQVSSWNANSSMQTIENILPTVLSGALLTVFPAVIGSILLGEEVLTLMFGSNYAIAYIPLIVLIAGKIPEAMNSVFGKVLLGLNRPDLVALSSIIFIISMVILNYVLIDMFGLVGVSIATSLSIFINMSLTFLCLRKVIRISFDKGQISIMVVSSLVMGFIVFIVKQITEVSTYVSLVLMIILGMVLYAGPIVYAGGFSNQVREIYDL